MVQQKSFRLVKSDRSAIKKAALAQRFDKDFKRLKKTEEQLAKRCYEEAFPVAIRNAAARLPDNWLDRADGMSFNVGGENIHFNAGKKYAVPHNSYRYHATGEAVTSPALVQAVSDWKLEKAALESERETTEATLSALLEKCNTVRTLKEVWPQGERFWKDIDFEGREIGGVPAIAMENLNKSLGLAA